MISKINNLKNFGIFKDFNWNNLDEFKKKNLIYGWNYSGKTTLSRLFQGIEYKDKYRLYPCCEFKITATHDNQLSHYTQNDFDNFPFLIKVFNSQYVKDVFISEDMDLDIKPISFYLGDISGNLVKEIQNKTNRIESLNSIKEKRIQIKIDNFNAFNKGNGHFTHLAKEIRINYLNNRLDQNKLNKSIINKIAHKVKNNLDLFILTDIDRDNAKKEALSENTYNSQNIDYSFVESLSSLSLEVKKILEDSAPKSIPFPELDNDIELFSWVQKGLELHKEASECKFCTNTLPDNRINNLNSYYSKKLLEIQNAIESIRKKIELEKDKLNIKFPHINDLIKFIHPDYEEIINLFNETKINYINQLSILENDLHRKSSDLFNNISTSEIETITFANIFINLKNILISHNNWIEEFDKNRSCSLNKILNHYVALYLKDNEYLTKERDSERATKILTKLNNKVSSLNTEKNNLESQLRNNVKGQDELNGLLEILLHRSDVRIVITDNKFTLERNGEPATNLSEGEKSAIAFSYFLTELKALSKEEPPLLSKTIVFIDDPISSLDSNHIFQVRLLLYNFFKKEEFTQLFISTHNFEFFSVMLDTNMFGNKHKDQKKNKRALYFIKRNDNNSSTIKKLPRSFSSYKSEYVGLFHTIKDFNDLEDKDEYSNLLILPNAVRRFLELYTIMKYPSDKELDARMQKVFNPDDKPLYNTKLLHWFSHQNQFEKVQQHDEKIFQIEDIISELLLYIEQYDSLHWKGLIGE